MQLLSRQQGGVLTAAQSLALGADTDAIRTLIGSGQWQRLRRGVYGDSGFHPPPTVDPVHHQRCAALLASLGGPAVVSHLSAARLLRLPLPPGRGDCRAGVTRRPPAPTNDPLLGDVHVTGYDDADVVIVAGVPVLAGARLVLDCCEVMGPDSALAVADAALRRRLASPESLRAELARRRARPGSRRAARIVERADPRADNWFESMSRWWLLELGLPTPQLQATFADEHGDIRAQVDFWLPHQRTVGEADGAGKYDQPGVLFAEKRREDWLRDIHRVEVVRWTPEEMRTPAARRLVVARFHRAFGRRS